MPIFGRKKEEEEEEKKEEIGEAPAGEDDAGKIGLSSEERWAQEEAKMAEEKEEATIPGLEEFMMRIEKLEGRMEANDERWARLDERLMTMSEQIGELRTMQLEREKSMGELEADFELIKTVFEDIKPSEIAKELEQKERSIIELRAKAEKFESLLGNFQEELSKFRDTFSKIRGLENLVEAYNLMREQNERAEETKKYIERLAAKVESIFAELSSRIAALDQFQSRLEALEEVSKETIRSVDELEVKLKDYITSEDVKDFVKKADVEALSKEIQAKIDELSKGVKAISDELRSTLKEMEGRLMKVEKPSDEIWREIKRLRDDLLSIVNKPSLEELVEEREKMAKEGNKERVAIIDAQIEEMRRMGRMMRMIEDLDERIRELSKGGIKVAKDEIEKLAAEISDLRREVEGRAKIDVPKELRKSIEKEISDRVEDAVKENLKKADLILAKKLDEFDKAREEMKDLASSSSQIKEKLNEVLASIDALSSKLSSLEETTKMLSQDLSKISLRVGELEEKSRGTLKGFVEKSVGELTKEREKILSLIDALKMRYEEGLISRESYDEMLRENVEKLNQIDLAIEQKEREEKLLDKVERLGERLESLSMRVDSLVSKDELEEFRREFEGEGIAKVESLVQDVERAVRELEMKFGEQKVAFEKLARRVSEEEVEEKIAEIREKDLIRVQQMIDERIGKLSSELKRREDELRREIERVRRDLRLEIETLPYEGKIVEQHAEIEQLRRHNEEIGEQLKNIQRLLTQISGRTYRRSLSELLRERERLLSIINSKNKR